MASTRLTTALRHQIRNAALKHRFAAKQQALRDAEEKLFTAVREHKYGKTAVAQMDALPEGWLPTNTYFEGRVTGPWCRITTAHPIREPAFSGRGFDIDKMPARLSARLVKHVTARDDLDSKRSAVRKQLDEALTHFATLESLLKKWPELAPFTQGIESAASNLPTIPREQINKALGIAS